MHETVLIIEPPPGQEVGPQLPGEQSRNGLGEAAGPCS